MSEKRLRSNAEIDHLNQFVKEGETKLSYELNADGTPIAPELTEEQKLEAQQKQKAQEDADKVAEEEKKKIIAAEEDKKKKAVPGADPIETELDDEKVLAYFKNKKGKEITSLEDLLNPKVELTEEQKQAEKEKRDSNKFAYGLQSGKFTKKELETFINDTGNPKDLVYAAYYASQKAIDDTLKDSEIQSEFDEKFGLDLEDKESRDYKAGQLLLNNIAESIIAKKHSKILNLENDYSAYENSTANQTAQAAKIQAQTPIYKKDVEQIRGEIGKVSFKVGEEVFETDLDDAIVQKTISKILTPEYIENKINSGWTKDSIKQAVQTASILEDLPNLFKKYADAQVLKNQAGSRGIIPDSQRRGKQLNEDQLTDDQKKAQAHYKGIFNVTAGAN